MAIASGQERALVTSGFLASRLAAIARAVPNSEAFRAFAVDMG